MFSEMPQKVEDGSVWHVISTSWVKVWQQWVYLDLIRNGSLPEGDQMPTKPSKLDCSDIIAPKSKDLLTGISKQHTWQNIQLKHGLREEEDFLLVTPQIFEFATKKYGLEGEPIIRYGIAQADGETVVELYLAKLNLLVVPNALFKFTCAKQVLISRNATL